MTSKEAHPAELRVLILAPTQRDAVMSRVLLEDAGMPAHECRNLEEVCEEATRGAGAVLLTEESLGSARASCLLELIETQPAWSDLPVLVLTSGGADSAAAAWALEKLGNVTLLERPVRVNTLVSTAIRARRRQYQIRHHLAERTQSAEALRGLNETLEQRVAERTALAERQANQLRALASALAEAEQRERRRLAQLLHDHLQQMLVAAKLHAGMLEESLASGEQQDTLAGVTTLINDCINASRDLTVELSPPVLHQSGLTKALEWLKRWMLEKHDLEIELDTDLAAEPDSEEVRALIFATVRELLFNVVKHARVRHARVETSQSDAAIKVTVSDPGAGFDLEDGADDRPQGTGFGLFGVEQRLAVIGGRLEIDSAPGQGTCVSLTVPSETARAEEPATADQVNGLPVNVTFDEDAHRRRPAGRIRVLLVDDHQMLRQGIAGLLRGARDIEIVAEATDGESAVEIAGQVAPDVIVMDVNLPRMDGIEATRRIKARQPQIRIVGLAMNDEHVTAQALREAGASAFVPKGGAAEELVAAIRAEDHTA